MRKLRRNPSHVFLITVKTFHVCLSCKKRLFTMVIIKPEEEIRSKIIVTG